MLLDLLLPHLLLKQVLLVLALLKLLSLLLLLLELIRELPRDLRHLRSLLLVLLLQLLSLSLRLCVYVSLVHRLLAAGRSRRCRVVEAKDIRHLSKLVIVM